MKERAQTGFTLVEVAIATGIIAFCFLTLLGLLSGGLSYSQSASMQSSAANSALLIAGDLQATSRSQNSASPLFGLVVPHAGSADPPPQIIFLREDGSFTRAGELPDTDCRLRATVWLRAPKKSGHRNTTAVRILVTWPVLPGSNPTPAHSQGSFEAITALDRN